MCYIPASRILIKYPNVSPSILHMYSHDWDIRCFAFSFLFGPGSKQHIVLLFLFNFSYPLYEAFYHNSSGTFLESTASYVHSLSTLYIKPILYLCLNLLSAS